MKLSKLFSSIYFWLFILALFSGTLKLLFSMVYKNDNFQKSTIATEGKENILKRAKSETALTAGVEDLSKEINGAVQNIHNPEIILTAAPLKQISKPTPATPIIREATKQATVLDVASLPTKAANSMSNVSMSWNEFTKVPFTHPYDLSTSYEGNKPLSGHFKPILCPVEIVDNLAKPMLSQQDIDWCKWATSRGGGNVVVGKSWGNLRTKEQKGRFDSLNCNAVIGTDAAKDSAGVNKNPSCDDSWGDIHIKNWKSTPVPASQLSCNADKPSKEQCYKNSNGDLFCTLRNVQIDFRKFQKYSRGSGMTPSKKFESNFISTDCNDKNKEPDFPFNYLYSTQLSSDKCDLTHNGTVLMYSHDDIRNLGHTLNDVMNVWIMLWLAGVARFSKQINFLNIDSFKLGHNFDDQPNAFFLTYYKNFHSLLKGEDYKDKVVCFQELLVQPAPPRFFIWESWWTDLPCSFIGPSSLYQRWNMHVRHSYNLFPTDTTLITTTTATTTTATAITSNSNTNHVFRILLIVRNENTNLWGSSRTSRNYLNLPEIKTTLQDTVDKARNQFPEVEKIELVVQDLSKLNFEQQLALIASSSMMIGMHGAGIASSMHMSIGTKYCCGVLEIYPNGEFSLIKGHGNMARKMGLVYDRIDIPKELSSGNGAQVPVGPLAKEVLAMIKNIVQKPSCVLPAVVNDPYLENI